MLRLGYHDRVTIRSDTSAAGDPEPDYTGTATATGVPCRVISVQGAETFRGRQLEAGINYVVELQRLSSVVPTQRLEVTSGAYKDANLNIRYVKIIPFNNGRVEKMELHCRRVV